MKKLFLLYVLVTTLLSFGQVLAAPFCVSGKGLPDQCYYYDISQCKLEASNVAGFCSVNISEVKELSPYRGDSRSCIIESNLIPLCYYDNVQSCEQEANRKNALCFVNDSNTTRDDDLFIYDSDDYKFKP
jgi:hypothetical protein